MHCSINNTARRLRAALFFALFFLFLAPAAAQEARFQGLGDLPDSLDFSNVPWGMSSDGSVVVGHSHTNVTSPSTRHAYIWTEEAGIMDVEMASGIAGTDGSQATGVSPDGNVVLGYIHAPDASQAFKWTSTDGMSLLGAIYISSGFISSEAHDASTDASVIVGMTRVENPDGFSDTGAFRWTAETGMVLLADLAGGDQGGFATGVSGNGSVVVGTGLDEGGFKAVRWVNGGGPEFLGDLPGGLVYSYANDVSLDGTYVIGASRDAISDVGFIWTEETGMTSLGLPSWGRWSVANGVSDDGSIVVGQVAKNPVGSAAAIWTAEEGWRDIQVLLATTYGEDLEGWFLTEARAVSSDGTVIMGIGINPDGNTEGWRADLGCIPGVGKGSTAVCECSAPEYQWRFNPVASFNEPVNWIQDEVPSEDAIAIFAGNVLGEVTFSENTITEGLRINQDRALGFFMESGIEYSLLGESGCGPALLIDGDEDQTELKLRQGLLNAGGVSSISDGKLNVIGGRYISKILQIGDTGDGGVSITKTEGFRVDSLLQMATTFSSTADFHMNVTDEDQDPLLLLPLRTEIGTRGEASFLVEGKARITGPALLNPSNQPASIILGVEPGAQGTLEFHGPEVLGFPPDIDPNRHWTLVVGAGGSGAVSLSEGAVMRPDSVVIGQEGTGSLSISGGGMIIDGPLLMASGEVARGDINVEGSDSENPPSLFMLGNAEIGRQGEATLTVKDVGNVFATFLNPLPAGSIVFGSTEDGEGSLEVNGANARFLVENQQRMNVVIGGAGKGDMQITNGGAADADTLWIGKEETGFGSAYVGGSGSQLTAEKLAVGLGAFGLLHVENNGLVSVDELWIGQNGQVSGNVLAVGTYTPPSKGGSTEGTLITNALLLSENAQLDVASLELASDAIIGGTAAWAQPITNAGGLRPGDFEDPTGTFHATAGYTQSAEGVFMVDLDDAESDRLEVTGTAMLDGKLEVAVVPGAMPIIGAEYVVLSADERTGTFAQVMPQEGLEIDVNYTATEVIVRVLDFDASEVSVDVEETEELPAAVFLDQNYPNPFNPSTMIGYELAEPGAVSLVVYDVLGREIEQLVDVSQQAGRYEVQFDAGSLKSGIYIYRLTTPTGTSSRKMLLVK